MKKLILGFILIWQTHQVLSLEPNYTLPPITYMTPETTIQRARNRGHRLMALKCVPDGDATLVCTNWICPTSIVVNTMRYNMTTNLWDGRIEFGITTTNRPAIRLASGEITLKENAYDARLSLFSELSCTSMALQKYAQMILVMPIDGSTNMMFVTDADYDLDAKHRLVYKNIFIQYEVASGAITSPATNALAFTAALINAGLPEDERIPLPPAL